MQAQKLLWRSKWVSGLFSSAFFFAVNTFVYLTHPDFKPPFLIHIQINDKHQDDFYCVISITAAEGLGVGSAFKLS